MIAGAAADQDGGEAGAARGARRGQAAAAAVRAARARARADLDRLEDPVAGRVGDRQGPARVLPPPAAQGDPGGARRGRRAAGRDAGAARADRAGESPRARAEAGGARASALRAPAAAVRRARRDPQLPGVDRRPAVVEVDRGQARPEGGAQAARRRPLRHREGQGPHPRVPRRPQAQARHPLGDPLLRRAARGGQDLARQVDRRGDGAQVRAHLRRRRARRVGDPRPPPHLHRGDARDDPARPARRGLEQPRADDRRDRQDGRGLPRRPRQRDARGAGPRAELDLPRPLPGPAVRPLAGPVHHHRQPARADPAGAARSHGGDPARGLHRGGEARDRQALPGAPAGRGERPRQVEDRVHRGGPARGHRRLHARGRCAQPRARDRGGLPQGGARVRRGDAQVQAHDPAASR